MKEVKKVNEVTGNTDRHFFNAAGKKIETVRLLGNVLPEADYRTNPNCPLQEQDFVNFVNLGHFPNVF